MVVSICRSAVCRGCPCRRRRQCRWEHGRRPAQSQTAKQDTAQDEHTESADSADGLRVKLKTPRGKSSPVRVTCTNLATNEITGKDSTPIDATGTENVGVRVPRREHNIACGAGSRRERRRHEQRPQRVKSKLHMAAARASRPATAPTNSPSEHWHCFVRTPDTTTSSDLS